MFESVKPVDVYELIHFLSLHFWLGTAYLECRIAYNFVFYLIAFSFYNIDKKGKFGENSRASASTKTRCNLATSSQHSDLISSYDLTFTYFIFCPFFHTQLERATFTVHLLTMVWLAPALLQ
jgi:hypothetical protein